MSAPNTRTEALYQKDGTLHTHTTQLSNISLLSTLPASTQSMFKPPHDAPPPYLLATPATIFHAQGGGQPSDTGTILPAPASNPASAGEQPEPLFTVHQVRKVDATIWHMGYFSESSAPFPVGTDVVQTIDAQKRLLHSRYHTAGHVIGLAVNQLSRVADSEIPPTIKDGKASHYPSAAFVEFAGLIPSSAKAVIQARVDELVARDTPVRIHFWDVERAREACVGGLDGMAAGEGLGDEGVRVVEVGGEGEGAYPCGGTHVQTLGELGSVVIRGIKRQKGISKVSYEVVDGRGS